MHVVEFMRWTTGVTPPTFHKTGYTLQKLKKLMACERPEGRRLRTGFTVPEVCAIFTRALGGAPTTQWYQHCHLPRWTSAS
jgi:hypothetical protein